MAKHTIELRTILRGFSSFNDMPMLYASPMSVIEGSRENFFKAIGGYPFKIWGDERDDAFKIRFESAFLEHFYMNEIGFQTPDAFILKLGEFLRRKMPIYTTHWRMILEEMYVTNTGNVTGNTVSNDRRTIDSWGKSVTDTKEDVDSLSNTHSEATQLSGTADTPQNELDMDLNHLTYASTVTKGESVSDSETKSHTESVGNSETNSEDHTVNVGAATGDSVTDNYGRGKDVFDIYDQWITSGYDLFKPLFVDMMKENLFCIFL